MTTMESFMSLFLSLSLSNYLHFSFYQPFFAYFHVCFTYVQRRQLLFKGGLNLVTAMSGTLIFE